MIESFREWIEKNEARGTIKRYLLLLFLLAVLVAVGGIFLHSIKILQSLTGGLSGIVFFGVAYAYWYSFMPDKYYDIVNIRGRYPLNTRRWISGILAGFWLGILALSSGHPGYAPFLGPITVTIILTLWRVANTTPEERKAINDRMEALWANESYDEEGGEKKESIADDASNGESSKINN
jgi:hypothetical protein